MPSQPLHGLNLNSLVALDALLKETNVTRAARRVGITQPAMSQTLSRLREQFDDPLLVRRGRVMVRSPRADAMLGPLNEALEAVEQAVQIGMRFDPATTTRVFRVAMTDLHVSLALPRLLAAIQTNAPGARLEAHQMSLKGLDDRLSSGAIDLAVGFAMGQTEQLHIEPILEDEYVCLVRKGHRLARRKRLRITDYADHHHVANTPVSFVPAAMSGQVYGFGARQGVRASLPYLLAMPAVVRSTDFVATVPSRLLDAPIDLSGLVVLDAPEELPPVVHSLFWHTRFDRDPAHAWLREQVRAHVRDE